MNKDTVNGCFYNLQNYKLIKMATISHIKWINCNAVLVCKITKFCIVQRVHLFKSAYFYFGMFTCSLSLPSSLQIWMSWTQPVSLSFPLRHREAWANLLDEFQLHLQVLQRGPGVKRGWKDWGVFQRCHHAQWLPQTQTPGLIGDNNDDVERGCEGAGLVFILPL